MGAHPQDYLQFFAVGNRESVLPGEPPPERKVPVGGGAELAQLSRRFMIYVHSKMMIVDDEVRGKTPASGSPRLSAAAPRSVSLLPTVRLQLSFRCAADCMHEGFRRRGLLRSAVLSAD